MNSSYVNDNPLACTSAISLDTTKGHHRRTSSLWVPPSRPVFSLSSPKQVILEKAETGGRFLKTYPLTKWLFKSPPLIPDTRIVVPNNLIDAPPRYMHPNRSKYADNEISTTKYSVLTFLPKNLLEQLHRAANLYFIFIVILNMIIGAFGKYVSLLPISFVLGITAVKDAFEDYRRYKSDRKINHSTCRVWDSIQGRYRKLEWQNIIVGDFVHLSHDEIIPADMLLLRSSDLNGVCYVDTCNLDGESNLKQRQAIRAMGKYHNASVPLEFSPDQFKYNIACEEPTTDVYKFEGRLEAVEGGPPLLREFTILAKENVLLRGCVVKNTDFVEGIVLYAGHDTKAMLNNNGPRYKRSSLEKLTNIDILWCVVILLLLCFTGALLSGIWLGKFSHPYETPFLTWTPKNISCLTTHENKKDICGDPLNKAYEAFFNFWSFIIVLQVLIPISLYVSIEFIKVGQIWFMSQDKEMYYDKVDKRLQCRALNIPEELGQIQYVMSDKTGTLTENQMVFRRCTVIGKDFGGTSVAVDESRSSKPRPSKDRALESLLNQTVKLSEWDSPIFALFLTMAVCNTVVVNAKPHEDLMDDDGDIIDSKYEPDGTISKRITSQVSVKFLEEVEEEPVSDSPRESIELIEFNDYKTDNSGSPAEDESGETAATKEEPVKETKGILHKPSILSLARLKGIKDLSPFRRSVDKRQSLSSTDSPPIHSFYDSESPDELALVEAAREYGMRLLRRRFDEVVIFLRGSSQSMKFKVLHTLPFDADRKRMSVVVRECSGDKRVILLTKGADSSVLPIISKNYSESTEGEEIIFKAQAHLSDYAKEGLRTLCLAKKIWDEDDYQKWRAQHEEAELDPHHRENLIQDSTLRAEQDVDLLGVTAIEDRLQDGVPECIHSLREAGIKVWVLTGDKVETAVNIAFSSRLFSDSMDLLNIGASGVRVVSDMLDEHLKRIDRATEVTEEAAFGLVLNAAHLDYCIDPYNLEKFVRLLSRCKSVLCCRATPLQKATLVKIAKNQLKGKVLAIGDGANDVSMIQGADVGVGLSGQEGMQAVMASDFAMARFRFLSQLLLVHGHWCYHRLAQTILYFFYKNAMFVFAIFWYQIFNGFSSQVPIDPLYLMVYNLLFTSVPALLYGCLEQDATADILLELPKLYDQGRLSKKYRWYSFWLNMADAVWQSAVVYWLCHFTYYGQEVDMWTFGLIMCAQLLIANSLHLALLVQYWTWPMFLSIFFSVISFFVCSLLYNGFTSPHWTWTNVKDPPVMTAQYAMIEPQFWLVVILTCVLCLLPRFILTVLMNTCRPSRVLSRKQTGLEKEKITSTHCLRVICHGSSNNDVNKSTVGSA